VSDPTDAHDPAAASASASPLVGVVMGSRSDWDTMQHAVQTLASLGVPHEVRVVSAHRTPDLLFDYAGSAAARGLEVVIAGAGGAAHLPGMIAAKTVVPVLGVPVESRVLRGVDSLLSIVQMPAGIPVGTLAIGRAGATNAALLAAAFLGNKQALQQGYFIAEPFHITSAGGKAPRFLSTWDAGFRAYAVLITNKKFARENPAALRAFTRANIRGWEDYLTGDPTPAHTALKKANANNTDAFLAFSRQAIIDERLVTGRDATGGVKNIGRLDAQRYATQIAQLEDLALLPKGKVPLSTAFTTEFLP
jgi:phosphoribosylaminoimidazole carboxylase PurE protein